MTDLANQRYMPPSAARLEVRIAKSLGMDDDARSALAQISALVKTQKIAVAGRFMPDAGVSARLASLGVVENVHEADFFRFSRIVIPYGGVAPRNRRDWEEMGHRLEDLSSPQVRRAQVALGLLRMEGAQAVVIGRHDNAETRAIARGNSATNIIEDTTDTARLVFSPSFGVVCQTNLSPRKVSWLVQQLRHRYRDARVTFLETISPAMAAREEALERLLVDCDQAVIVGEPGESSCEALVETALRRGKQAAIVARPEDLDPAVFSRQKVAFTAGAFATDEAVHAVAAALAGK
jgi:4-hydroxy-3-methylbut-2-enyl diphosphate reductase IspH